MLFKSASNLAIAPATGASVTMGRAPEPLQGAERDEIAALVARIKQADARQRTPHAAQANAHRPSVAAIEWAENWQLPREVHEYFVLETAA